MAHFTPRRGVQAISHINVVVDDIEVATKFYRTVLQAANADGPMDLSIWPRSLATRVSRRAG
jgi:hypothetical protein